ncbi:hypothetical protein JCM10449v2_003553 [Rhodotorula kratochvilovae]
MADAASAQAELLALLASLPPDTNPYDAIGVYLRDQLYPTVPQSATYQLYGLAGALGTAAILIVISLLQRWQKGIFWVVRMQQQPRMVRPHWSISWSLIAFVMIAFFEVFIGFATEFFHKELNPDFAYWFLIVWMFAWWGGQTAAWSLAVSYILHLYASTGRNVSYLAFASNLFGLATPVVYIAALLPLAVIGGHSYSASIRTLQEIERLLAQASAGWTPGDAVSIISLAPALPLLDEMVDNINVFLRYFRIVFIYFCVTAVVLVMCLVGIATVYLTSLRRVLATTRQDLSGSTGSSTFVRRPQQAQITRTLRSLLLTIISFSFLGAVFALTSILAALSPRALVSSPLRAQILILLPLYAFAIFGLPCALILVLRARDATAAEEASGEGSYSYARSRTFGPGALKTAGSGGSGGGKHRARGSAGASASGQQFAIQLTHLDSGEPFPPPAFADVASRGAGDDVRAEEDPLGGVKVAVDVSVVVDDDDEVDEKYEAREMQRGAEV